MPTVNITPLAGSDGITYADDVPLTSTEADLNGGDGVQLTAPIPIMSGQTIVALVQLSVTGHVNGNSTYIFLQTDLGDGVWVDVAWCFFNKSMGSGTFILCGGGLGAMNNAIEITRNSNSAPTPQGSGSNAVPLGGRVRFTGFSRLTGGSSSAPGVASGVDVTIKYRLQNPR